MLKSIQIKDFQSHQDTCMEFSPGVNVIVGESNAGKSACIRAINWVLNNRPLGESFIRKGQSDALVDLIFDGAKGKVQVIRSRGKSKNYYELNAPDFQGEFTAFGQSPPAEITNALNLSDINLQGQFSPSFLVFDSPGSISEYLRNITGLQKLDKAVEITAKRIRTVNSRIVEKQESLDLLKDELDIIQQIPLAKLEELLDIATHLQDFIAEDSQSIVDLSELVAQITELESKKISLPMDRVVELIAEATLVEKKLNESAQRKVAIEACLENVKSLQEAQIQLPEETILLNYFDDIIQTTATIQHWAAQINNLSAMITSYKAAQSSKYVDVAKANRCLEEKAQYTKVFNETAAKAVQISDLIHVYKDLEKEIASGIQEVIRVEEEVQQLKQQLDTCPSCGSILTEQTKKILLGNKL